MSELIIVSLRARPALYKKLISGFHSFILLVTIPKLMTHELSAWLGHYEGFIERGCVFGNLHEMMLLLRVGILSLPMNIRVH